jgi:hypothetical protein
MWYVKKDTGTLENTSGFSQCNFGGRKRESSKEKGRKRQDKERKRKDKMTWKLKRGGYNFRRKDMFPKS